MLAIHQGSLRERLAMRMQPDGVSLPKDCFDRAGFLKKMPIDIIEVEEVGGDLDDPIWLAATGQLLYR